MFSRLRSASTTGSALRSRYRWPTQSRIFVDHLDRVDLQRSLLKGYMGARDAGVLAGAHQFNAVEREIEVNRVEPRKIEKARRKKSRAFPCSRMYRGGTRPAPRPGNDVYRAGPTLRRLKCQLVTDEHIRVTVHEALAGSVGQVQQVELRRRAHHLPAQLDLDVPR